MTDARAATVCLWLALVFPSSFVVDKYLGWESTIAYGIIVAVVVALKPQLSERVSNRSVLWLALLTTTLPHDDLAGLIPERPLDRDRAIAKGLVGEDAR